MADSNYFRQLALSFPGATESPHFEKTSFRVNKKIFATLSEGIGVACLKLSPIDQSVFCAYDKAVIYPVPNKWGQQGWTFVVLSKVKKGMLKDILTTSYHEVVKKK
ncbi:MAG: MmcQ/YjbR family DNA-binding protein [Chitinophagaceae bacterium]|nr:MmcQ/YjbR family DNA-binding protein [Chitinophagaceae bacterium]